MKSKTFLLDWLLLAIPTAVRAQFTYTVTNQTVTITGYTGANLDVAIPNTINGLPVTSIGYEAFWRSGITGVTIPDSVTNIGDGAFGGCTKLTRVTIPNGVTIIGNYVFGDCSSLTSVTIPNSVANIGDAAFIGCSSLTNLTLGSGVTSIGGWAFRDCSSLGSVTIPDSVTGIGRNAFQACTSLSSVTIPNSVTNIGDYAFSGCSSLSRVTIPDSVTSIGESAFAGCSSLTNLTLGSGVTRIGVRAFGWVWWTNPINGLTNITVDPFNPAYRSVDGVLFNQSQTMLVQYPGGKIGGYMIPNGVTRIGEHAFEYCTNLTRVTIPNSVTNIGDGAFNRCSSLTNLTLGSGVTSIGDGAFAACTGLRSVTLDNGLTSMGIQAFRDCSSLSSVTIPNSVTDIGDDAFSYCTRLTSVYFQGNAPSLVGTSLFNDDFATIYYLPGTGGWGSTFAGQPTALWTLPYPLILNRSPSFGVRTNQFGFTVSWATNLTVVVEACTNLANPIWSPVGTNTLTDGSSYFSVAQWRNYPARFYRLRSP